MKTKLKTTKTLLCISLLSVTLNSYLLPSNIIKATNENNAPFKINTHKSNLDLKNTDLNNLNLSDDIIGKITPFYDGWAGSNGVTNVIYMDFNDCYEYAIKNNSNPLRSLLLGLGASFLGPWVGAGTAVADYAISQIHGTLYYKCHEAIRQKKGVLIRFVSYKVNYWTYPTIKVSYYSIM